MAKVYCMAFGCLNNNKDRNLTFFSLPKDIERRREWLKLIDREDLLQKEVFKRRSHVVCSAHFEDSSIKIIKHLQENALPTMLLQNQPQEGSSCPEVQSTSARSKRKGIKLSNNTESLRATEEQTQTSKSLTEGTPPNKRKLSDEIHELVAVKSDEIHKGFTCNVCSGSIVGLRESRHETLETRTREFRHFQKTARVKPTRDGGASLIDGGARFRYTCVQCDHYSLCAGCEARGEHSLHYVLRIPRPAPFAEVVCMMNTIRLHLIYGLGDEAGRGAGADDRVVPALPVKTIKAEIKEEPSDPLEQEAVLPEDNYTESDIKRDSASKDHAPVETSTTILTDTIGNYIIIENPVKVAQAKPKNTKHKNTTEPEHGSEKRMKMSLEEETQASATAGPSIEGASREMLQNFKTEEEDEGSFQVFSHTTMTKTATQAQPAENTDLEVGSEGSLYDASTSQTSIGVTDNHCELTISDWLEDLPNNDSDDEDLNIRDDYDEAVGIELSRAPPRNATDDIADNADLSLTQTAILQKEEEFNDRQTRQLAPSEDYYDFKWTSYRQTFAGEREEFLGTPGPTFSITDETRPIDVFYKMFTTDFIDMLVTETNRYAEQTLSRLRHDPNAKRQSRLFRWTPTSRDEMMAFLAFNILQGLYPKPIEEAYFSIDGYGTTPYFKLIMSYNRYHLLKTFQHFVDNDTTTDNTKLYKIQPVISYLNEQFSSLYAPGQEIAVDEYLLKCHGRLSFSQKILTKAAQVGVKTYELCESSTGYLWSFFVYTGKDGQNRSDIDDANIHDEQYTRNGQDTRDGRDLRDGRDGQDVEVDRPDNCSSVVRSTNATAKIVYKLVEPLLHKGHTLVMDNFYNSPLLARCLKRDGQTDVYGTLRLSREFVPEAMKTIKKCDLRQGEVVATYSSDLSVMVWRDSNLVSMISTFHPLQVGNKDNSDRQTYKPVIVLDYNKSMGGVDRKDQFLAGQPLERQRNKIWYKKLFRRLYNLALFNCFVLFTSNRIHKLNHRKFRTVLAEDILKVHRQIDLTTEPRLFARRRNELTTTSTTSTVELPRSQAYVESNHFPIKSSSKSTVCRMCKKSRTAYKCLQCNVPLCILICLREYHKLAPST